MCRAVGDDRACIDATPKDGRTETVSSDHLPETLAWLARVLKVEPVATEEPGMPNGRKDGSEPGRPPWPRRLGSRPRAWTAPTPGTTEAPKARGDAEASENATT